MPWKKKIKHIVDSEYFTILSENFLQHETNNNFYCILPLENITMFPIVMYLHVCYVYNSYEKKTYSFCFLVSC